MALQIIPLTDGPVTDSIGRAVAILPSVRLSFTSVGAWILQAWAYQGIAMHGNIFFLAGIDPNGILCALIDGPIRGAEVRKGSVHLMESLAGSRWGSCRMMLDFSKCSFIDSSGVGWLIETNKQFAAGGGMLVVHSLPPTVAKVFNLMRLEHIMAIAPDANGAAELLHHH